MDIHHLIADYGYWGLIGALCMEYLGIPFPAETIVSASGFEWAAGVFHFLPLYLSIVLGTFTGSLAAYWVGIYLGRPVILRYGKYVGITKARLDQANEKFNRFTVPLLIFSRFLAGVRVLTPYLAGINRTPLSLFTLCSLSGSAVWAAIFLLIGRFLGHQWAHYHHMLKHALIPLLCLAAIIGIGVWLLKTDFRSKDLGSS